MLLTENDQDLPIAEAKPSKNRLSMRSLKLMMPEDENNDIGGGLVRRKNSQENFIPTTADKSKRLFEQEKKRRDAIFRDKNAANFNIIGKKSFAKKYPIKRIKKVFFNDILSYEEYMEGLIEATIHDPELDVRPISRQFKEVIDHTQNIVRVKAQTMDMALKMYVSEARAEFIEQDQFTDSCDEFYENPHKLESMKERRARKEVQHERLRLLER